VGEKTKQRKEKITKERETEGKGRKKEEIKRKITEGVKE
jgi:hypothetical protein